MAEGLGLAALAVGVFIAGVFVAVALDAADDDVGLLGILELELLELGNTSNELSCGNRGSVVGLISCNSPVRNTTLATGTGF